MYRLLVVALFVVGFVPGMSSAVDIKNVRPCHGPFGATRSDRKCLPGDVLFMTYDIEDLAVDPKTGKTNYITILELLDEKGKVIFKKETMNDPIPQLGGARMPGDLHIIMGPKQAPGTYAIRLSVHDKLDKNAGAKAFEYKFEVVAETFGFVGISAPAVGFPGQQYVTGFGLVNMKLGGKGQDTPDAEVMFRILDDKGVPVTTDVKMAFPRDLPDKTDLKQANFVPITYPVFLNRPGRYIVEVLATDKAGNKKAALRYPVTVLDVNSLAK
jgi:hypothetical protein